MTKRIRLGQGACARLWPRAPGYRREGLEPGVVHLGLGAFHRAHQALVFDALLRTADARWGVVGVSMRNAALADALAEQDGLYALRVASREGVDWHLPGAIWRTLVAARERFAVVNAIAAPTTRWITLTVTEKGYGPELAALIVDGLALRQAAALPGLTIASCDNLSANGQKLRALCLQAAQTHSPSLQSWIETLCAFPCSMVDRIVPAATTEHREQAAEALCVDDAAALGTEGFWEWVIEDAFVDPTDAQALAAHGVLVVKDVSAYEEAKLRMLNGSHSAMAAIGAVAGLPDIASCVGQPKVRRFVHGLMTQEVAPHLKRKDWPAYRDALLERFANPELRHSVHQISSDGSQKIPQRWVPCALAQLRVGGSIEHLAFAAAAWMRFAQGVDEQGRAYAISDPLAAQFQPLAALHAGSPADSVQALMGMPSIWGAELPANSTWVTAVQNALERITGVGVLSAIPDQP